MQNGNRHSKSFIRHLLGDCYVAGSSEIEEEVVKCWLSSVEKAGNDKKRGKD